MCYCSIEGIVVAEEYKDTLLEAWDEEQHIVMEANMKVLGDLGQLSYISWNVCAYIYLEKRETSYWTVGEADQRVVDNGAGEQEIFST